MRVRLFEDFKVNLRRASPLLVIRFVIAIILLLPAWIWVLLASIQRSWRWRRQKIHRKFLERHRLAFLDIDEDSLEVKPVKGGLSNLNLIWFCRTYSGEERKYFVKLYLPLGTFWAVVSSWVTPYPQVYGIRSSQRFTTDMVSRAQLAESEVAVPKLIAYDARAKMMVAEYIEGEPVDKLLRSVGEKGKATSEEIEAVRQCGVGVGKVHAAGFSMLDVEPSNCMWVSQRNRVYFIDLEYCTREDKRAWDIGYFFCSLTTLLPETLAKEMKKVFLEGYRSHYEPDWIQVEETGRLLEEYLPFFRTILDIRKYSPEEVFEELFRPRN